MRGRLRRLSLDAWLGLATSAAAGLGLAASFWFPWLSLVGEEGSVLLYRGDVTRPPSVLYERNLAAWPVWAFGATILLGGVAAWLARAPDTRRRRVGLGAAKGGLAVAGFILALTGTRWLGFYGARLMDAGPTIAHLQAAPYINLVLGLALLGVWLTRLGAFDATRPWWNARGSRLPWLTAAASAGGLLLLPLLPFARTRLETGGWFHYDELTLATLAERTRGARYEAATDLEVARLLLWAILWVSASAALAALPGRSPRVQRFAWAYALVVPLAGAAGAYSARLYRNLPHLAENTTVAWNQFLPLTVMAVAGLLAFHAWKIWLPLLRGLAAAR